jgi:hypothetical protein
VKAKVQEQHDRKFHKLHSQKQKRSDKITGWSVEGKWFVSRMLGEIRKDEQDGICKKWEHTYKKISKATKQGKAQRVL